MDVARDESEHALIQWEAEKTNGSIGEAIVVGAGRVPGLRRGRPPTSSSSPRPSRAEPLRYWAGAGWTKSGDFASEADWKAYVAVSCAAVNSPVKISSIEAR